MVDIIGLTRLWALSFVDSIGMWTLSLKYDGGHYRAVGTIAGELTLSQKYNGEHYRTVGTIAGDLTLSLKYYCGPSSGPGPTA